MFKSGYIAIIGRPNSGKSTLLNAILQTEVSIVTPKAQTTRDRILGIFTEPEGQIVFVDTPGIHRAREGGINEYMVSEAKEALNSPNVIWYLVDPTSKLEHELAVLELLKNARRTPVILLINKMDEVVKRNSLSLVDELQKVMTEALLERGILLQSTRRISGGFGEGVSDLLKESWGSLPEGQAFYPDPEQVSDRPTRFFVAEKIRARLFYLLGDELPYSCAVEIESFNETSKPIRIEATIYVERESQKGIVIGDQGKKIKEIGQTARHEIEKFLGEKIFLGLKVKLLRQWTQNGEGLRKAGYNPPSKRRSG